MKELSNNDNLLNLFPVEQDIKDSLVKFFLDMKADIAILADKHYQIKLPDKVYSEIIQLFYFKSIGMEKLFEKNPKFQFGIQIIRKHMNGQEKHFITYLQDVALRSYQRGIPKEQIESYITQCVEIAFKKVSPDYKSILDELMKYLSENKV